MFECILASMNTNLQPEDEPLTLDDVIRHTSEFNAWIDDCKADTPDSEPTDFDSMSTVEYLKQTADLDKLWEASVKDALATLKHSQTPELRRQAERILETDARHNGVREYDRYSSPYLYLEACDFGNGRNPIHNALDRKFSHGWQISGKYIIELLTDGRENPLYYEAEPVIRRILSDWKWDKAGITNEYQRGEISSRLFLYQDR